MDILQHRGVWMRINIFVIGKPQRVLGGSHAIEMVDVAHGKYAFRIYLSRVADFLFFEVATFGSGLDFLFFRVFSSSFTILAAFLLRTLTTLFLFVPSVPLLSHS